MDDSVKHIHNRYRPSIDEKFDPAGLWHPEKERQDLIDELDGLEKEKEIG